MLVLSSCRENPAGQIPSLEAAFARSGSSAAADSLVQQYLVAVKANPGEHENNLRFLTKAAEIKFLNQKDAVGAVRLLNQGLKDHGVGLPLAEPVGMLARIWCAYQYKSTPDLSRNPDDIDLLRATLEKNLPWIDSSLAQLDKELGGATANLQDQALEFIQISEAYSILVQETNPDKQVDLLLKAAGLAKTIGDPNKALRFYYNVAEKMPAHHQAPTALFMMAFIYENDLKDLDKAKSAYELFLQRYPNDPDYADDAKNAIRFLGMSPEEIIRQFENNPQ
ncbi:MAG: tetratricopeptide repeat protein [Saprospirales bacterium]|nr:tetratricopeptide repeat protein [Saprospirales bacterium]